LLTYNYQKPSQLAAEIELVHVGEAPADAA